jgi:hypothetical protein
MIIVPDIRHVSTSLYVSATTSIVHSGVPVKQAFLTGKRFPRPMISETCRIRRIEKRSGRSAVRYRFDLLRFHSLGGKHAAGQL